jgi:very-short-patch-repair endonuclease
VPQLQLLAVVLVGVVILIAVARLLLTGGRDYPFRRKDSLFSKGERAFYDVLRQAVGNRFAIFAKVRLEDLVDITCGSQDRMKWANKVRQKHADFVLCTCDRLSPVLVIELDDASHNTKVQQRRDEEKNRVLQSAGLPLLRYRARASYSAKEITQAINERLKAGC